MIASGTSVLWHDHLYVVVDIREHPGRPPEAEIIRRGVPTWALGRLVPLAELTPLSEDEAVAWCIAHRLVDGPRLVCAWCRLEMRSGSEPASHGICAPCLARQDEQSGDTRLDQSGNT